MTTFTHQTCKFKTWDGIELFHRFWPALKLHQRNTVLFHGGHEHSGRFEDLVKQLGRDETAYIAWDARGHGHSPGQRGYANSVQEVTHDLDLFLKHLIDQHGLSLKDTVFIGHSVGSLVTLSYIRDYSPKIRGLVLGSPAIRIRTY